MISENENPKKEKKLGNSPFVRFLGWSLASIGICGLAGLAFGVIGGVVGAVGFGLATAGVPVGISVASGIATAIGNGALIGAGIGAGTALLVRVANGLFHLDF